MARRSKLLNAVWIDRSFVDLNLSVAGNLRGNFARMIAFVFPGQGSQTPGMGRDLCEHYAAAAAVFDEASAATAVDVRALCFESDEDKLRQTQNAQLALFTCGVAAFRALQESSGGIPPGGFAGHSVGEHAALAASGALSVFDGAKLVRRRGELMAAARGGTMAAVLGLERDALEQVCSKASSDGEVVVVANDNCPGQLVISGDVAAVERARELAGAAGAKRVLPLNVSGAFHSPLMEEAAAALGVELRSTTFSSPIAPVYSNVTAHGEAGASVWPDLLERQLRNPVRWTESVQAMQAAGIQLFIECGCGEVLCGLIRRIDREARSAAAYDGITVEAASERSATS